MRLFIAIQLDPNLKKALTDAQTELRQLGYKGRFTNIENMHLTLAFIGEFNDPDLIFEAMEQVQFEPFSLTLGGYIGNFGDLLWAGIDKSPQLEKYVKSLRHALSEAQIPFDGRKFNPHITLMRDAASKRGFSDIVIRKEEMSVCKISLMRSDFGKHGAVYTELGSVY